MQNWFEKDETEIIKFILEQYKVDNLWFVGKFSKEADQSKFVEVRDNNFYRLIFLGNSTVNSHLQGKNLWVESFGKIKDKKVGEYYKFKAKLLPLRKREERKNPFAFQVDDSFNPELFLPKPKEFIENRYRLNRQINLAGSSGLAKAINSIQKEINKSPETFIYELLQNANDYPVKNSGTRSVKVTFDLVDNFLLFCHSGSSFNISNVHSLCGISDSDKREKENIGFKGIGFKSVFKDCDYVLIQSGGFSFSFDKEHFFNEEPFQIIPIWTNVLNIPVEAKNSEVFQSSNVSIALKPRDMAKIVEYERILRNIFSDSRILLFLPEIGGIKIIGLENDVIELKVAHNNFKTRKYKIAVLNEEKEWLNNQINAKDLEIPEKYWNLLNATIEFATEIKENKIVKFNDAVIFNYLPTKLNLGLNFLINGDFIPDGTREFLFENRWNFYLMEEAGKKFPYWIKSLGSEDLYLILMPDWADLEKRINDKRTKKFIDKFIEGAKKSITVDNAEFIRSYSGKMISLQDSLLDKTGLLTQFPELKNIFFRNNSEVVDFQNIELTSIVENLIQYFSKGEIFNKIDLKEKIQAEEFRDWLKQPQKNIEFIKFLSGRKELIEILKEPIFLSAKSELKEAKTIYKNLELTNFAIDLLHPDVFAGLSEFEVPITFQEYEENKFFDGYIFNSKSDGIKENSKAHWEWIYDNWEKLNEDSKIKLKEKSILCKNGSYNPISKCYIPNEYFSIEAEKVESILNDLGIGSQTYVSESFITKNRPKEKWLKVYKKLKVKSDLEDVITDVIENLSQFDDEKHFRIGKEVFDYWRKNETDQNKKLTPGQITKLQTHLKLKCVDLNFFSCKKAVLSDHFRTGTRLNYFLVKLKLETEISADYDPKRKYTNQWYKFFIEILNCIDYSSNQEVLKAKTQFFISKQEEDYYTNYHFEYLKELSRLYSKEKQYNLNFKEIDFSKILLYSSNSNDRLLPKDLHLSDYYCNSKDLKIQFFEELSGFNFLSGDYKKPDYYRGLFKILGVRSTFEYEIKTYSFSNFPNKQIANRLMNSSEFMERRNYLLNRRYSQNEINEKSRITNYVKFYGTELIESFNNQFFDYLISNSKIDLLFSNSDFINGGRTYKSIENNFVEFLRGLSIVHCRDGQFRKPTKVFSYKFRNYLPKRYVPNRNLTKKVINSTGKSLEEAIGIQQKISSDLALELITDKKPSLTEKEVEKLDLISILTQVIIEEEHKCFLPNVKYVWKPTAQLFTTDEYFEKNVKPANRLHSDFERLAKVFKIKKLSEDNLKIKTEKEDDVTIDIISFFQDKAIYLASKLNNGYEDLEETKEHILSKINEQSFLECEKIKYVFPENKPIYEKPVGFIREEEVVKFTGFWKNNEKISQFIYEILCEDKLPRHWFNNFISRWDKDQIISKLEDDFGKSPWNETEKEAPATQRNFIQEVEDYIDTHLRKVEEIYNDDRITDLKNLLQNFSNHTRGKQKAFNLLAKLKLCKTEKLFFNKNWERNEINEGSVKYFIHSARGAFAYIHPNEILRMRDEGFKMAIDYGRLDIRIYETADEIINLYQNYLMLYQSPEDQDDVMEICEESTARSKFHFLIVDEEKGTDDVKTILKLLNVQKYE